uniref:Putative ovule protein n=1 Tax=Solanum chacoense TaxID=4108 RepID=A0A0V0GYM6_SOLCH
MVVQTMEINRVTTKARIILAGVTTTVAGKIRVQVVARTPPATRVVAGTSSPAATVDRSTSHSGSNSSLRDQLHGAGTITAGPSLLAPTQRKDGPGLLLHSSLVRPVYLGPDLSRPISSKQGRPIHSRGSSVLTHLRISRQLCTRCRFKCPTHRGTWIPVLPLI